MEKAIQYIHQHREEILQELFEFLRIPSISALSEHKEDMVKAATWLQESLTKAGLEHAQLMATGGHPVVYADHLHADGAPTILIYGHYDVQPVDPLPLWETPPFEPSIRDGRLYARGASDDKGQIFMHVKVLEAILKTEGRLPYNFKILFEGEEEIGSAHLDAFVEEHQDLLKADLLVISDTPMLERGRPAICYGLRGLAGLQIDVKGPKSDLHSGGYGGVVQNPIHALVELLATMHDADGKITVDGFYDRVKPLSEEEKEEFKRLHQSEESLKEELGVPSLFGEKGYTALERNWARPTLEINGIYGGFQGERIKTVIPSEAHAKITCRLVPDQEPEEILSLIEKHIAAHTPPGVTITTTRFDTGRPYMTPIDHPAIHAASRAYERAYGVPAATIRMGGSIPIVETFVRFLKLPVILMGFGLPNENFHAPNEFFTLENFDKGLDTLAYYWHELKTALS